MIKNIILDIGGIIIDDSINNLANLFKLPYEDTKIISKILFKDFKETLLGNITMTEFSNNKLAIYPEYKDYIELAFSTNNFSKSIPFIMKQ